MEPIKHHKGTVYPLYRSNIDTDQIIPKQFLKRIERQGFGQFLFFNWRFDDNNEPRSDFSLNRPEFNDVSIMVSGENFGCGSSREHAPWAIQDFGFRVVIAPSFADIFYNNCVKNGILPVVLPKEQVEELVAKSENGGYELNVDLENQRVYDEDGFDASFDIPDHLKQMLINGWDEISITLNMADKISAFETSRAE
ncbi:3-isopropylmalate dehydratase small subunit [Salisediminibacterium halotolerans]|uniref:3-isopropylmalate dehydratase small subunit n=1 Tax=Salisediminibacterium halotolerans TaxID=517425 RepID=A0A1H9TKD5_9BACI|nr:3-isopropylmalate dehydratase small subunit [Salisediminibacterium haloalkalitolerans]SER97596.1 3-isopropylmalate/(R)-2-methylmalate dehydratase small subunit [Salisediminibacterium haloalkalitolerans]